MVSARVKSKLQHRANVRRLETDNSGLDTIQTESVKYANLPCLMLGKSATARRNDDRQVGAEVYELHHADGQLAINDRVDISDKRGNAIRTELYAGPTEYGIGLLKTELQGVAYGRV